nr:solute carrier family 46 member 3-like [Lytechinus pictus]
MTILDIISSGFRKCGLQLVLFLYIAGMTLQFPIWQNMIIHRLCLERYGVEVCDNLSKNPQAESEVQMVSSRLLTIQSIFTDIPGAIAALLLGSLSDKIGRKRVLLFPCCGSLLLSLVLLLQSIIPVVYLPLVILSCLIFGVSGGIQTFMTTAVNIITDTTPVEKRAVRISRTMPFFGLGMVVGMLCSGILPQFLSITQVYLLYTASQFIVVAVVLLFFDETLPKVEDESSNGDIKENKGNKNSYLGIVGLIKLIWSSVTVGINVLTSRENRPYRTALIVLLVAGMIANASAMIEFNLILLYTKRAPFLWSPKVYGIFSAFKSLMGIIGQAVGTGMVLGLLGERSLKNDFKLLQLGSISAILVTLFTAYASSTKFMMFAALFVLIGAPSRSANGSIVSRIVSPSQKGAFMSMGSFLNTLTTPILGGIYNGIYASSVETRPGLVFICMAVVHAFAFLIVRYVIANVPDPESTSEKTD